MNSSTLEAQKRPMRILMVEDNKGDAMLIRRVIGESGIPSELAEARTGESALELLEQISSGQWPDIILLDLNLPGISGHQVLTAVKGHADLKRIPVFILSSSRAINDIVGSYESYANCYLVKPHDVGALRTIAKGIRDFWYSLAILPNGTTDKVDP